MLAVYLAYSAVLIAVILLIAWFYRSDQDQQDKAATLPPDTKTLVVRDDTVVFSAFDDDIDVGPL